MKIMEKFVVCNLFSLQSLSNDIKSIPSFIAWGLYPTKVSIIILLLYVDYIFIWYTFKHRLVGDFVISCMNSIINSTEQDSIVSDAVLLHQILPCSYNFSHLKSCSQKTVLYSSLLYIIFISF